MEPRRVGLILVAALVVIGLLAVGVQGMMHQQWMQGFAVGQMTAQGSAAGGAAVAPYLYTHMGHRGHGGFLFPLLGFFFALLIIGKIVRRRMWRHHAWGDYNRGWGGPHAHHWQDWQNQPGQPQDSAQPQGSAQPGAGPLPPWVQRGPWMQHGPWAMPPQPPTQPQQPAQPGVDQPQQPEPGIQPPTGTPTAGLTANFGPQPPVDL